MARHEHADLIHLWAEGAEIEYKGKKDTLWCSTSAPQWDSLAFDFRIKPKEPEWHEKIPEHGLLCWVSMDTDTPRQHLMLIVQHLVGSEYPFVDEWRKRWKCATPLTDDEIRMFLRGEQ